jgi:NAD(P)-dependent dehydrogenase (short-subunit alcohol dehydrogenase family)
MAAFCPPVISRKRVAVVTGAARGIGQAICRQFARDGVIVAGVDLGGLGETGGIVTAAGGEWLALDGDVSEPDAVSVIGNAVLRQFDGCDILINCAGIWPPKAFEDLEYAEWKRVLAVNLDSQFLMSKAFVPSMKDSMWGRIVNFTSGSILSPVPNFAAYKASKMGIIGLTRAMSADLGKYGITVNAVSPALTPTPGVYEHGGPNIVAVLEQSVQLTAIQRVSTPDDVVGLVMFLAGDAAAFITGQTILADGGRSYL